MVASCAANAAMMSKAQFDESARLRYTASSLGALSIAVVFCGEIQIFRRIDG